MFVLCCTLISWASELSLVSISSSSVLARKLCWVTGFASGRASCGFRGDVTGFTAGGRSWGWVTFNANGRGWVAGLGAIVIFAIVDHWLGNWDLATSWVYLMVVDCGQFASELGADKFPQLVCFSSSVHNDVAVSGMMFGTVTVYVDQVSLGKVDVESWTFTVSCALLVDDGW